MGRRLHTALVYFGLVDDPDRASDDQDESFVSNLFGYAFAVALVATVHAIFGFGPGGDFVTLAAVAALCVVGDAVRRIWRRGAA